ncbi:HutD/Ves family protein [Streptomyces sp. 6N106]|uniref:HutD/Ves family protein n=1 Tax=Streptomyces sp. 6N106 TaxID=3457418 RepID=UPI003FD10BB4
MSTRTTPVLPPTEAAPPTLPPLNPIGQAGRDGDELDMPSPKKLSGEPGNGAADTAHIIPMATLEPQRWANGRGWTREIHREPAADSPQTVAWRLSLADIEDTGPFSPFPGMERHLLSAAPVPLQLSIDGVVHDLRYTQIVTFGGTSEVATTAVHGRAQALNLMVRSGIHGSLDLLEGDTQLSVSAAFATALVVLDGIVTLDDRRLERFDTILPGTEDTRLALQGATVARVRVETSAPDAAPASGQHRRRPAPAGRPHANPHLPADLSSHPRIRSSRP